MTRKLLTPAALAEKLGYAKLNAPLMKRLDRAGFPQPVLGADAGNRKEQRWDELAIDLWLDIHMPPALRAAKLKQAGNSALETTAAMQQRLATRAQEMRL